MQASDESHHEGHSLFEPSASEPPAPTAVLTPPVAPLMRADADENTDSDATTHHIHFNPFLALLWLVAAALVGAGFWAQARVLDTPAPKPNEPPTVEEFYVIPAVLGATAPWLIAIGLATVVVAVALHAFQWIRTHES